MMEASQTTVIWFVCLVLAPWPIAQLLRRAGLGRHEASLIAYNVVAMSPNLYMAAIGCQAWWFDDTVVAASTTVHTRLYMPIKSSASLISVTLGYELWNTLAALVMPEYRTVAFVGHHATTFYLATLATHPFLHYYCAFFLGPPSLSSVLLGLVDIFRYVDVLHRSFPMANLALRASFAVTFMATRTIMWPLVALRFWRDVGGILFSDVPHSRWACGVYLAANAFLTGLQLLWTLQIVKGLHKAIRGLGGTRDE